MAHWSAKPTCYFPCQRDPVPKEHQSALSSGPHMHIECTCTQREEVEKRVRLYRNSILAPLYTLPELRLRGLKRKISKYSLSKPPNNETGHALSTSTRPLPLSLGRPHLLGLTTAHFVTFTSWDRIQLPIRSQAVELRTGVEPSPGERWPLSSPSVCCSQVTGTCGCLLPCSSASPLLDHKVQ